jgi:hypothetical protein
VADKIDAELLRLGERNRLERLPLDRESALRAALRKVPGRWTKAMCEALGLPSSSRDTERKAAIAGYLTSPGAVEQAWRDLPGPSRRIVSWLVLEKGGSSSVRELYEAFGEDEDSSYHWNKGELPTTPLGLLRLYGLVYKGMEATDRGRGKVAVVPVELRPELESAARGKREGEPAPPMLEPAFRKQSGLWETLELENKLCGTTRPNRDAYQYRITLKDIEPPVWRRILVPGWYSFWDLHVAIQDVMGWLDYHLHEFHLSDPLSGREVILGVSGEDLIDGRRTLTDYLVLISEYPIEGPFEYLYDFGDDWLHEVELEAVWADMPVPGLPECVAGERACPPEDCGGPPGYAEFLRIIGDPTDGEHGEMLEWVGGSFEPERFDPSGVHFDDPRLRWRLAILGDEGVRGILERARETAVEPQRTETTVPVEPGRTKRATRRSSSSHKWQFKARFRSGAYSWKGTSPASKRLREAVSEIRKVARKDPVTAADGVVTIFERLWPALQGIDSSSGRLGIAVARAIDDLIPLLIEAPADRETRSDWMDRLYEAVCEDGVDFLFPVQCRWGEICVFPELVDYWIDSLLPGLELCQEVGGRGDFYDGETICLSCLLEGGRYGKLEEVVSRRRFPYWPLDRFWAEALARMGKTNEAAAFAESRQPDDYEKQSILEFCERVILEAGREDEAYYEYGLGIRRGNTYLASYREIVKRYPRRDPERILIDLVETSQERGKWFAAARQAGYLDIARECARSGLVEPKTLVTAARDSLPADPAFSYEIALRALDLMVKGYGYDLAVIDIKPAFDILFEAADALSVGEWAEASVRELLDRRPAANNPDCEKYLRKLLQRRVSGQDKLGT